MDRCGSGGLPIYHLDRPDIYFPDVNIVNYKTAIKNSATSIIKTKGEFEMHYLFNQFEIKSRLRSA